MEEEKEVKVVGADAIFDEKWDLNELENDFLCAILSDDKRARKLFVDYYKDIKESFFKNKTYGTTFKTISLFFEKERDFPTESRLISVLRKIGHEEKDIDTVKALFQDSKKEFRASELSALEKDVESFIRANKAKTAIIRAATHLNKRDFSDKILQDVKEAILWNPKIDMGVKITEVKKRYSKLREIFTDCAPTPWKFINENTQGGLFRKMLTIFCSASSVGKSIALDQLALHTWLQGKNVVMITLELSAEIKGQRIDSCFMEKEIKSLLANEQMVEDAYKKYDLLGKNLFIKEFATSQASALDIENYLYQLELYEGLRLEDIGLLAVDYGDIMVPIGGSTGSDYQDGRKIFENLRGLAQNCNLPVATASQFNRKVLEVGIEELSEGHLADSWWKMNSADVIVALWNNPELREQNRIFFKFLKNRLGPKNIYKEHTSQYEFLKFIE